MQAAGLRKRIEHTNCRSLVVGISGGLDSCLALLVAVRAMDWLKRDRKDIIAVTMPCFGTTQRTKGNAEQLSEKLGVTLRCIDIAASVQLHFQDIGQDPDKQECVRILSRTHPDLDGFAVSMEGSLWEQEICQS
ncbi:MAG: hypothetical protein ACLTDS_16635 [Bianqueaceae bacterium]